jgi:hypothetical protein
VIHEKAPDHAVETTAAPFTQNKALLTA